MKLQPLALLLVLPALGAAPSEPPGVLGYYRMPDVHGDRLAFVAEGDVWTVPVSGGLASRLTRSAADEKNPRFSPDGAWIAYTGGYEGGADVYVIPAAGGAARRLTFNPEEDLVEGWTPDGRVLYRSSHLSGDYTTRMFTVSPDGGPSTVLPMVEAATASIAPDGKTIAFTRFSTEWMHTRRYLGGLAPDVWIGDLGTKRFTQLTTWGGTDASPMWHGQDRLFFQSDRTGVRNLWSCKPDGTDLVENTAFDDFDVRAPALGGDRIAFQHGADIWVYDIAKNAASAVDIRLETDRLWNHAVTKNPLDHLDGWDLAPDGKSVVVEARGEVAVFPAAEGGRRVDLTRDTPARERGIAIAPDGKHVAWYSDASGDEQLELTAFDGLSDPVPVPATRGGWHFPAAWAPKSDVLAYGDQTDSLWLVDVATKKRTLVDRDPGLEITDYRFSPDGRWLAYVRTAANGNRVVWLYDRTNATKTAATDPDYNSYSPAWDPDGKYLYFASQRDWNARINGDDSSPQLAAWPIGDMPELDVFWDDTAKPYAIALAKRTPSPFLAEDPLVPGTAVPDEAKDKHTREKPNRKATPGPTVTIDPDGLASRTFAFPVDPGNVMSVVAVSGRVLWLSFDEGLRLSGTDDGNWGPGTLRAWSFADREETTVGTDLAAVRVSADGSTLGLDTGGAFSTIDADAGSTDGATAVAIGGWTVTVIPSDEWAVIYDEAWRLYRDYFWSPKMVGVDWQGEHDRYAAFLPRIGSRDDLADLIGETIAELSNNHAYTWGGDRPRVADPGIGQLGADLAPDPASGVWRITRILPGLSWDDDRTSPLRVSYADIRDGDYLFAIDGQPVEAAVDPASLLVGKGGADVVVTVGHTADPAKARPVVVHTLDDEGELRHLAKVVTARQSVDAQSGGQLGYVALRDMGETGLQDFADGWFAQADKRGFIVDVRQNGGGYISNTIIARLNRELVSLVEARNQDPVHEPWRAFVGPIVVVCDQGTASDGESFSQAVQDMHLGTIVGMRTWGGLVGFRYGKDLLDGGLSEPEFAFYDPTGAHWQVEGPGVVPDVVIDRDPTAAAAGKDPQLDKAVAVALEALAKTPVLPGPPEIPDKSLAAWRKAHPVPTVP
jgi:tricorn protease